jgi:hypothetical protein
VPQDCGDPHHDRQGYNGVRRGPEALYPIAPDIATRCTAPLSTGTNVRGSAHVPGGDPISTQDAGIAYPDVVTSNMRAGASGGALQVGEPTTPNNGSAGSSWLNLLSAGIR